MFKLFVKASETQRRDGSRRDVMWHDVTEQQHMVRRMT